MRKFNSFSHDRHAIISRLIAVGLRPIAACSFADQVLCWARSCGDEWCVSHLKGLKQQRIRACAGLPLHPSLPTPKGAAKHVFSLSERVSLDCLNIYTMFRNPGPPTAKQLEKFLGSMEKSLVTTVGYESVVNQLSRKANSYGRTLRGTYLRGHASHVTFVDSFTTDHQLVSAMRSTGLESWGASSSRRAPAEMFKTKTRIESSMSTLDHMWLVSQPGLSMYPWDLACSDSYVAKASQGVLPFEQFCRRDRDPDFDDDSWFGTISFIQEGGYKLRAIANPIRPLQCLLAPLGFGLYQALRAIVNDFTHDHEAGIKYIQNHMLGQVVYSVDLSDATNNMPLEPQLALLKSLGAEQWEIDLFHHASRGLWSLPKETGRKFGRWTVGQPLGVFPSFASFALMHHLICELALDRVARKHHIRWRFLKRSSRKRGKMNYLREFSTDGILNIRQTHFPWNLSSDRPWAIIGDDLVIFDEEVYKEYMELVNSMDIPVSSEKTLISSCCAEFAKRIIFRDHVILPIKWSPVGDAAVFSYLKKVGRKGLSALTPKQRRIAMEFAELPEPYGLGWNPRGLGWSSRVPAEMEDWYRKGTAPFVAPRDDEPPMTDVLPLDVHEVWFVGTNFGQASAYPGYRYPTRKPVDHVLTNMSWCGLPVLSNVAQILYENLVKKSGNSYQFKDDQSWELMRWYQGEIRRYNRSSSSTEPQVWPAARAIRRARRNSAAARDSNCADG